MRVFSAFRDNVGADSFFCFHLRADKHDVFRNVVDDSSWFHLFSSSIQQFIRLFPASRAQSYDCARYGFYAPISEANCASCKLLYFVAMFGMISTVVNF